MSGFCLNLTNARSALERARFLTVKTTHFFNGSSATLGLAFARDSDLGFFSGRSPYKISRLNVHGDTNFCDYNRDIYKKLSFEISRKRNAILFDCSINYLKFCLRGFFIGIASS
jgi:hypothetical protein